MEAARSREVAEDLASPSSRALVLARALLRAALHRGSLVTLLTNARAWGAVGLQRSTSILHLSTEELQRRSHAATGSDRASRTDMETVSTIHPHQAHTRGAGHMAREMLEDRRTQGAVRISLTGSFMITILTMQKTMKISRIMVLLILLGVTEVTRGQDISCTPNFILSSNSACFPILSQGLIRYRKQAPV